MNTSVRRAVLGPGETDPVPAATQQRSGEEARKPLNDTAFRQAERFFKCRTPTPDFDRTCLHPHRSSSTFPSSSRLSSPSDMDSLADTFTAHTVPLPESPISGMLSTPSQLTYYTLDDMEGFYFIPNPLSWAAQQDLVSLILTFCMGPPYVSNLDDLYVLPKLEEREDVGCGVWPYVLAEKGLLKQEDADALPPIYKRGYTRASDASDDVYAEPEASSPDAPEMAQATQVLERYEGSAIALLRKLRWVTIGQHYDWTTKEYVWGPSGALPLPCPLGALAQHVCRALPGWSAYLAQAGILNFYQVRDSLTGHVDRSEENDAAPLFSLSLGASAVFLVGGKTRDDPVRPFLLKSGDMVILSGPCRRFYHGVPRIIQDSCPKDLLERESMPPWTASHWPLVRECMEQARINVNIRQLY